MITESIASQIHKYFNEETLYSSQLKAFAETYVRSKISAAQVQMDIHAEVSMDGVTFEFIVGSGKDSEICYVEVDLEQDFPDAAACAQHILQTVITAIPSALAPALKLFPISTPICLFKENKIFSDFSAFLNKLAANKKLSDEFKASLSVPEAYFIDKYDDHASISHNGRELCRIVGDNPDTYRLFNPYAQPNANSFPRPNNIFEALCFAKVAEKAIGEALGAS